MVKYTDDKDGLRRLASRFSFACSARLGRKWKYNKDVEQHWVEFEESGDIVRTYMQRSDYVETKNTQNRKALEGLSSDAPLAPLSVDNLSGNELPNQKPNAQQEVQAHDHCAVAFS